MFSHYRKSRNEKGFTLIEMLITVSIFSVAAIAISSTFSAGISVWKREKNLSRGEMTARIALEKITRDFRNSTPFSGIKSTGNKQFVSFPSLVKSVLKDGEQYNQVGKVTWFYNSAQKTVYRKKETYQESSQTLNVKGKKILEPVEEFSLSFYSFDTESGVYSWVSEFSGDVESMKLFGIKVELSYKDSEQNKKKITKTIYLPRGRKL